MGINADQAIKIVDAFKRALNVYYGSSVATLKEFQDSRRKTYMLKLEEKLEADKLRKAVADKVQELGNARGVVTTLENNRQSKLVEMQARFDAELAELKQKQAEEKNKLVAHYEPSILDAKVVRDQKERELEAERRKTYFLGISKEDDGRSFYSRSEIGIDLAIKEIVDGYIENNLSDDPEGQKVLERIKQTDLVTALVSFEKNVESMRASFLEFIDNGYLPPVTIIAWKIKDGKDMTKVV
jgi:hypothetical protein